ncbi:Cu,Zn superoxide dismutase-like protein [Daldinia caldariorum]|uniref:Cu,Zn superoxide dismutase-like protein n=1 Tax=Daldinia caldariorum TaxID=326644 RepID=UPI0020081233|nr:Cu,Zn superoxide dismutase-like protein [Daldinia caldariorum]KAI1464765.1 Cu,Zn superoxide dismutase-like protein [Daldinia caldariorum]
MMLKYLHGIPFRSFAASTSFIFFGVAAGSYYHRNQREQSFYISRYIPAATGDKMVVSNQAKTPFQTLFAVPMTCDGCVKDVSDALYKLGGITKVEADLEKQLISVEGTAAPSAIVSAIEATGRDAILRGSGASNSAAVCILETYHRNEKGGDALVPASAPEADTDGSRAKDREVRGLARMVQVSPTITLVDLTVRGVEPGTYSATIREYGDLKLGATSTGPVWAGGSGTTQPRGILGTVQVGKDGRGAVFFDHPFQVWEVIGHAMVVSNQKEGVTEANLKNNENTVVGVIARSAGMWDNDKTVCSCTGKTLWEERRDEVKKGML